ncbi:lantibiotic protection ABC transporter ATP-binding protein [Clostridium botulinum]|uniref:lantibiotic protection ABC transporter ATP-binding protein n=1 Tax=Clostridium botulinum TaxID=1491 RepID=UPI0006A42028|nr:lantibiotic protection ABC transporter ATP-binding protein [Clostridium botulinum]KOC52286.1 lantibiotic ABC transporter ATP-binding protein [Clostridium botulinum]KOC56207.1 lantibiotic ABC transporter ATP-binding protein [Clostridium botulinum]MCD3235053.1 lantibiotic protection ABC transporter ATP-binding protein [Clostridium botulinum D/C]MCD3240974.1 lantibiotic protection ABC transporter ATP-binding protein [Clostridium botulinum D/C]MCD3268421.1 lantibiotic protection ABC transporter
MSEYFLETKNLTKKFKDQRAVDCINLKIKKGSIYGFLGPNGAGKSTTLKMITGLLYPTEGEIIINGDKWTRHCLKDIGVLIESPAFYGNLTARENLKVHTTLLNLPDKRIDEVLNIVSLKNTGNKKSNEFSLGMKQRLGIAIALLNSPKLIILDEPTNGLDPLGIQELRDLIKSLKNKGITIIFSSHILSEVSEVAEYIGIIYEGKLKYQEKIDKTQNLEKLFMHIVTI